MNDASRVVDSLNPGVALANDHGLDVVFEGGDRPDLTTDEAEAVTGRIRRWVNDFPIEDVVLAFRGRVWVALSYASWSEWCECELGGLKLPAPKRREVVAELSGAGMSNRAIGDAIGVDERTVRRDATAANAAVDSDRKTLGQDGRERGQPLPKPVVPQSETVDAEIVCRDCDGYGCETCYPEESAQVITPPEVGGVPSTVQPAKPSAPRRRPLSDQADTAGWELHRAVERIERLLADDRFTAQTSKVAQRLRGHLTNAINTCQGVLDRLNQEEE